MKLEKGAKVRVRLHTGEVVDAVYDKKGYYQKIHHVFDCNGIPRIAGPKISESSFCRFVGPSCVLVPVGVRV